MTNMGVNYIMNPQCPHCKEPVEYYRVWERCDVRSVYELQNTRLLPTETLDIIYAVEISDDPHFEFQCPSCSTTLFNDLEDAEKFLRGEEVETN